MANPESELNPLLNNVKTAHTPAPINANVPAPDQPNYLYRTLGAIALIGICSAIGVALQDTAVHQDESNKSFSDAHKSGAMYGALAGFIILVLFAIAENTQRIADMFTRCMFLVASRQPLRGQAVLSVPVNESSDNRNVNSFQ